MYLTAPTIEFAQSFLDAQKELAITGDDRHTKLVPITGTIEEYLEILHAHSRGEQLPEGWVSYSTFWLIDNGEFIGDTHIRHELNDHLRNIGGGLGYTIRPSKRKQGYGTEILRLALIEAKKLGISPVLVTCDEHNIPSKKIIEANGGVYEKTTILTNGEDNKLLYWIKN